MNIGIFGGTFDPPHVGHLIVAESVQERLALEMILFMPAYLPPHKEDGAFASPGHRLRMLELAVAENPHFRSSDVEIRRRGKSYTIDTLRMLRDRYPADELFLIIGLDNLRIFPTWKEPGEVLKTSSVVVIDRPGVERSGIDNEFVKQVRFVQVPTIEISATDLRRRIREGKTIRYLVPESVRSYIEDNKLYQS